LLKLYREIFKLHRTLAPALRFLADEFVRSEWKRHKNADARFITTFKSEWNAYVKTMRSQSESREEVADVGVRLDSQKEALLTTDQRHQLQELKNALKEM